MQCQAILVPYRTEVAKAIRRRYGDRGGHCHFANLGLRMSQNPYSNTISTVTKDNLLCYKFE